MKSNVLSLPLNTVGRDWFVGDIHGYFHRLRGALDASGFNENIDRLISVGDLIDRGPDSLLAAQWLNYPWFFAVRGNHEEMFMRWRSLAGDPDEQDEYGRKFWFPNGGEWVLETSEEQQTQLEQKIEKLPYVITTPHKSGKLVGVVHADLPGMAGWPSMLKYTSGQFSKATWSRNRSEDEGPYVHGLEAVICGHTSMIRPTWVGQFLHIDTAGWDSGRFTLMTLDQVVKAKENKLTGRT